MTTRDPDDQLKSLFAELKRTDENHAPDYAAMRHAGAAPLADSWLGQIRFGMAAAVLLGVALVAVGVARLNHPGKSSGPLAIESNPPHPGIELRSNDPAASVISLDDWQSPTAFLLADPREWGQPNDLPDEFAAPGPSTQPHPRHAS